MKVNYKGMKRVVLGAIVTLGMGSGLVAAHEGEEPEDVHLVSHDFAGMKLDGGVTWFMQASSGAKSDKTALTYTLDLSLEKQVSSHGRVIIALEAGDGNGIDGSLSPLSATNYDAFYTELTTNVNGSTNVVVPSISQAYFEGKYFNHNMLLSVGKLDVHSFFDDNAYANDETDQFLSAIFSRSADTSYKQLDYYYAPGIVALLTPREGVEFTLIAANGNTSGFDNLSKNMYFVAQVNLKPKWGWQDLEGNYRFYAIQDNRRSFESDGVTPVTTFSKISSGDRAKNTAWGLSFDQALPNGIGLFARYSHQDSGIRENQVDASWSGGASLSGELWGRNDDVIGLAYGSVNINTKSAVLADLAKDGNNNPDNETHAEVYYKVGYSDHLTITPDVQVISNIGGDANNSTVVVYGVRGQLNF